MESPGSASVNPLNKSRLAFWKKALVAKRPAISTSVPGKRQSHPNTPKNSEQSKKQL